MSTEHIDTATSTSVPLVVDLDGTLLRTDVLVESILILAKHDPLHALAMPLWVCQGRAAFKQRVAEHVDLDPALLPYRADLLAYLHEQRAAGRKLVLATAADRKPAQLVATHLGLFDEVLASDGTVNMGGEAKCANLIERFGKDGFDYAGDARRDLPVWSSARRAIMVDPSAGLRRAVERTASVDRIFEDEPPSLALRVRALRLHQWAKNLLVLVPLIADHKLADPVLLLSTLLAFVAFGLCASATYLINDLLDLPSDRSHPRKCKRPFASGTLPLRWGLLMAPILFSTGLMIGLALPGPFAGMLIIYISTTLLYSLYLKSVPMLDVITLSLLYTLRIMAGSAAVEIWPSHWLLGFSIFLFLSLAMVKRYGELTSVGDRVAKFRGYQVEDGALLAVLGGASGYIAVLVLALYIATDHAREVYSRFRLVWMLCPLLLFWISHVWLRAHRGEMDDDPLVFALKDRASHVVLALAALTLYVAA